MDRYLLTTAEAASFLNISPKTLVNWRLLGIGPRYVKIGRRIRYRKEDLESYIQSSLVETAGSPRGRARAG